MLKFIIDNPYESVLYIFLFIAYICYYMDIRKGKKNTAEDYLKKNSQKYIQNK